MKIRLLLKKRNKDPESLHPIYVALYEADETQLIYTGQRIKLSEWSTKDLQPKDHKGDTFKEIERIKGLVNKAKLKLELEDQYVSPLSLKLAFENLIQDQSKKQRENETSLKKGKRTVLSLATVYCENLPETNKESTKKTLKISIHQFIDFLLQTGKRTLTIAELNSDVIREYGVYLLSKQHGKGGRKRIMGTKKGLANSTYNKRMKHLSQFLKSSGINLPIKLRKVRKRPIMALTLQELRLLEKCDVTLHKDKLSHNYLQRAKDMFLLGCYTSLRISDLKRINPTNSTGGFINITTQKNNEVYRIPILPEAKEILERYDYKAPRISEQEVNRSIKKVCELAGIDTLIEWEYSRAGKDLIKTLPKYELITSHVAGKTFITNAKELWDLEPAEVAAIVRKDLRTMLNHYFKAPLESAIKKMLNSSEAIMKVNLS